MDSPPDPATAARRACRVPRRSGTRISGERFRIDHATFTGASYPGTSRLYEFTNGFVIAHIPRAWRSSPPT